MIVGYKNETAEKFLNDLDKNLTFKAKEEMIEKIHKE